MSMHKRRRAAEIMALIRGFREKKPNLRQIARDLVGERPTIDLEGLEQVIEESHARVAPDIRRRQLEERERDRWQA